MHGPERIFDVELAFDGAGLVHAMRMRAIDNVGAYAGRSPLQLGKPVGAIVGPYRIGASPITPSPSPPTRRRRRPCAASARRPPTTPSRPGSTASPRRWASTGWRSGAAISSAPTSSPISSPAAPPTTAATTTPWWPRPSSTSTGMRCWRSGTGCAPAGVLPASASPAAWSPAAPTPPSSRCSTRRTPRPPGWNPAASWSMRSAPSRSPSTPPRPARATRRWPPPPPARRSTSTPTASAWCAPPRWRACRATAPSAAAWRSCWAARPITPGSKLRDKLLAIAAHQWGVPAAQLRYRNGGVEDPATRPRARMDGPGH